VRYPSPEDYLKAVQRPESFTTDELRRAELVVHPVFQIPMPASGTSAVVFKAVLGGEIQALRFFTRDDDWSADRYDALHAHFLGSDLEGNVAMPQWVQDGIEVNGQTWPVVRMQWVEGHTLNKHVDTLVAREDVAALNTLADQWLELVVALQRAEFAHGDLQHGNVMVDERGTMRLVDFDCSWIARFLGWPPPSETGHRNYQPETRPWGRWMDTFSGLLIYTSLRALAKSPTPWHTLNTGENMLFRREDFRQPHDTATWTHLAGLGDRRVDDLARRLIECCGPGWAASSGLDELIDQPRRTSATHAYVPRTKQWWELAAPGTPVAPVPASPGPVRQQPAPAAPHTPRPYGPARQPGAAARGPWPTPGAGPASGRPPTAPRGPRPPGATWWQDKPGQPAQAPGRARPARGARFAVALLAVFLGVVAMNTVLAADDDLAAVAILLGIATAAVAMLVGRLIARRR
jgi:hypothetical protein